MDLFPVPNFGLTSLGPSSSQPRPPRAPFHSRTESLNSLYSTSDSLAPAPPSASASTSSADLKGSRASLSVNYLPAKFSSTMLFGGPKRRKVWKGGEADTVPKRGGGREAFRSDEARMPRAEDEDFDGVTLDGRYGVALKSGARWNRFKWTLIVTNSMLTAYSIGGLVVCLLLWFNSWENADIIRVGNRPELIISTLAASLALLTALVGWAGILLNNRAFLSLYTLLLWVCFALLVTPGYITYKRRAFNLEGKLNQQWSRALGLDGRLRVQNQLRCCGYFSPFVEATVSQTCYARSVLPGCKAPYLRFERTMLEWWYTAVFALVPPQITVMVAALLCSNHITYRFGKGMMPKAYRLDENSLAVIMDNYTNQLAEQYGPDVASEIVARSRSSLRLDSMPTVAYSRSSSSVLSMNRSSTIYRQHDP
ncbi:hypothetical protein WOLCODRAFT_113676 [Wolfiporia cocos MD-104 SS10]|uniref:Tetraspanin Tsp2 n=1 Tax=Wolfiporia cocos (strain MD-104) TaxID=742152 RepID=A0A2H3J3L1_WOLCO|nr:hypothetical protein WOLCODRAFT_113676 [Wolfiporia cocos MD-104 SS10]